ncbi:hypothetical protein FBU30_003900 [Linnemannia zychae]|nr:hypothetical protein FBU30_003900 [Linnemannia zychae]
MLSKEQLSAYFVRIGYDQKAIQPIGLPSLRLLQKIQALQLASIPYENLSLHWRPVQQDSDPSLQNPKFLSPPFGLSTEGLFQKLVVNNRGGYCLELNLLLGEVLLTLGFEVVNVKVKILFGYDRISERLQREDAREVTEEELCKWESFEDADSGGWETHQMLLVTIPLLSLPNKNGPMARKQYLVDVGLAKYSLLDPIELSSIKETVVHQGRGVMGKQF